MIGNLLISFFCDVYFVAINSLSYSVASLVNIDRFGTKFANNGAYYIGCTTCKVSPDKILRIVGNFNVTAGVDMATELAPWELQGEV